MVNRRINHFDEKQRQIALIFNTSSKNCKNRYINYKNRLNKLISVIKLNCHKNIFEKVHKDLEQIMETIKKIINNKLLILTLFRLFLIMSL